MTNYVGKYLGVFVISYDFISILSLGVYFNTELMDPRLSSCPHRYLIFHVIFTTEYKQNPIKTVLDLRKKTVAH